MSKTQPAKGVALTVKPAPAYARVLTGEALGFVAALHRAFDAERRQLLARRGERQKQFDKGLLPDFLPETASIRAADWRVGPIPADLQDRRVEIVAPTDRRTMINALNSGARAVTADFEDSTSPGFDNLMQGQINLIDRWRGDLGWTEPATGRRYGLAGKPAVVMVRPRGLHLDEAHVTVDGKPVAGSFFDVGLYVFHNARTALARGSGPYVSLPKLESRREARLWNDVLVLAQSLLGLPLGTIKATALIETLPAAFEMDEIVFELRDHLAGLACGHRDLIFSFIKTFAGNRRFLLPDGAELSPSEGFPAAFSALLIKTCHRRACLAMGGMAAPIPSRKDAEAHRQAIESVHRDAGREARGGHDGMAVAHPELVPVAMAVFDELMPTPNQLYVRREEIDIGQKALLEIPPGTRTAAGWRGNIRVGVHYIAAWLAGRGAVPLDDRMGDTATAEIARAQVWQWLKFGVRLDDGPKVTRAWFDKCVAEEMQAIRTEIGAEAFARGRYKEAVALFVSLATAKSFEPFLTLKACRKLD